MKKILTLILFSGGSLSAMAQAAETSSFWTDPFNNPMTPFYALISLISVVIVLILLVAFSMIRVINTLTENIAKEKAEKAGLTFKPKPSLWSRFVQRMNASVPVEQEQTVELEHNYDGIRELDNHLPPWWKYLFYFTIVWSAIYLVVYHVSDSLPLQDDEYRNQISEAEELKKKLLAGKPKVEIDESTLSYSADAAIIAKGKEIYNINCQACHKADGGGMIGPNLADDYWIHGGDVKDVYAIVKNGVPEKGMVSWAGVLSPEQIRDVSFFVMSLNGTNPPAAKGPQGTLYKTAPPEAQSDSLKAQASL
jgi:cytochrome c oxidase cbb3-type subunit III